MKGLFAGKPALVLAAGPSLDEALKVIPRIRNGFVVISTGTALKPARRAGIRTILLPAQNERDLAEIPEELRRDLTFVFVERAEQVLENALVRPAARRPGARKAERRKATRRRT